MKKTMFVFILLFLISVQLTAETIIYRNGTIVYGKVIAQKPNKITVKTKEGKVIQIAKRNISKVVFKDVDKEAAEKIRLAEEAKLAAQKKEKEAKLAEAKLAEEKKQEEDRLLKEKELGEKAEKEKEKLALAEQERQRIKEEELKKRKNILGVYVTVGSGKISPAFSDGLRKLHEFENMIPDSTRSRSLQDSMKMEAPERLATVGFWWKKNRFLTGADFMRSIVKQENSISITTEIDLQNSIVTNGTGYTTPDKVKMESSRVFFGYNIFNKWNFEFIPLIGYRSYFYKYKSNGFAEFNQVSKGTYYTINPGSDGSIHAKGGEAGIQLEKKWKNATFLLKGLSWKMVGNYDYNEKTFYFVPLNNSYDRFTTMKPSSRVIIKGNEIALGFKYPIYKSIHFFMEGSKTYYTLKMDEVMITFTDPNTGNQQPDYYQLRFFGNLFSMLKGPFKESNTMVRLGIEKTFDFKNKVYW